MGLWSLILAAVPGAPPGPQPITRRLATAARAGFVRTWIESFLQGSGCCCGAAVSFGMVLFLIGATAPLWQPQLQQALPRAIPGFELPLAAAALAVGALLARHRNRRP
ncbi:MAG: hypothetical protein QXO51_02005 [Halobacteria archaeon]